MIKSRPAILALPVAFAISAAVWWPRAGGRVSSPDDALDEATDRAAS